MGLGSRFSDLYHERTNYQFMYRKWRWALLSGTAILAGVLGFVVHGGFNLGIDFEGGTSWEFTASQNVDVSSAGVRDVMRSFGLADSKIIIVNGDGARVQAESLPLAKQAEITQALADYGGIAAEEVSVSDVGPTWGKRVSQKALQALIVFFVVIAIYLSLRFEWKMAAGAIVAVTHDILITVGVYAITGFEVTPATVIAFLTILGFSLYDTVVVFDKVKENEPLLGTGKGLTYTAMVNRSTNQVLARSLNTSLVALMPVVSLLVVGSWLMGALSLRDFGLALFVGLVTGVYSSIFVATPLLVWWREREPRMRTLHERAVAQAARLEATGPPMGPPADPTPRVEEVSCPSCGATANRSARFCPKCGAPLAAKSSVSPSDLPPVRRADGAMANVAPRARRPRRRKRR